MKKMLTAILACTLLLGACTNHGKKLKIEGSKGEVYYKGDGVTETDAKKLGDFLKEEQFFTNDKGASVQLTREGDEYTVRFVYDKKVYDTLKGAEEAFKLLAIRASKEVFGDKKVKIALASKTFKDFTSIPYDEALAKQLENPQPDDAGTTIVKEDFEHDSAGGVDFYWKGISDEESETIAKYIVENGSFAGGTAEIYMTKENDRYIIRFPVIAEARTNPAVLTKLEEVSRQIKDNVFADAAFSFCMTDERFTTIKKWDY